MSPRDQAEYIFNNPQAVLEMSAGAAQDPSGPPTLYEIKDGSKVIAVLDRSDYRQVLATVQETIRSITACKHHSKDHCECWRPCRDQLGYFRDRRGDDHPLSLALSYYWDFIHG